jgi:hypothetical protein
MTSFPAMIDNKHPIFIPYYTENQPEFNKDALEKHMSESAEKYMDAWHLDFMQKQSSRHGGTYPWTVGWAAKDYKFLDGFDIKFPEIVSYIQDDLGISKIRKLTFLRQQSAVSPHQDSDEDGWGIRLHLWNDTPNNMYLNKVRKDYAEKIDLVNLPITGFENPWFNNPAYNSCQTLEDAYGTVLEKEKFYINFPTQTGAWGLSNRFSLHGTDAKKTEEDKCILIIYGEKDKDKIKKLHDNSYEKYKDYTIFW